MLKKFAEDFRVLLNGRPGRRFQDFRTFKKQQREDKDLVFQLANISLGIILIGGGLAIGWLPGPGGFIALIGVAILARFIPGVPRILDAGELAGWRTAAWIRRWPIWLKFAVSLSVLAILFLAIWAIRRFLFG